MTWIFLFGGLSLTLPHQGDLQQLKRQHHEKTPIIPHIADSDDGDNIPRIHRGAAVYDEFCGRGDITTHRFWTQRHIFWTADTWRLESFDIQPFGVSGVARDAYARI